MVGAAHSATVSAHPTPNACALSYGHHLLGCTCAAHTVDGQSTVLYSANGPDLPGDELYEDDCICAADAIGILRHAHMDFIPARKEVVLRQRQDFVVSVLAQVLSHLTAPHHLIVAIARQTDAKEGVRTAVYLEQAWARDARSNPRDHRGAAVGVITVGSPHMRAICQMARKFGVNVLMPDLGLMEVSDKSGALLLRCKPYTLCDGCPPGRAVCLLLCSL